MPTFRWSAALLATLVGAAAGSVSQAKPPDLPDQGDVRCEEGPEGHHGHIILGWDLLTGRLRLEVGVEVNTADPPQGEAADPVCLDVWCPNVVPMLLQRLCARVLAGPESCEPAACRDSSARNVDRTRDEDAVNDVHQTPPVDDPQSETAEQARDLYEIALRCEREGNFAQARACLREAHAANPTCRYGRLAIQRLMELEADDACEQQEPPTPPARSAPRGASTEEPPLSEEQQSDEGESARPDRTYRRIRESSQPLGMVQINTY
jgi:hypothetical protein